jgi:dolichol-phosphate mannosyltransferase
MLSSSAEFLAVMDADLQHDERLLPQMLNVLKEQPVDAVVASRYMSGADVGDWDRSRHRASRLATQLSKSILKQDLSDPMSGFFMIRRRVLETSVRRLSGIGFKILADLCASSKTKLQVKELPYKFRERAMGESKFDGHAILEYLLLVLDKLLGRFIPVRFLSFSIVGASGVVVHLAVVALCLRVLGLQFLTSQVVATFVAIASNFVLNNLFTFRDLRLRGWRWVRGLASFTVVCSVGAAANVGVAVYVFEYRGGWALAAIAGILVGAVWNFAVSQVYTWRRQ